MPYRTNPGLTPQQEQAVVNDFARGSGWTAKVPDPDNPGQLKDNVSKRKWLNLRVDEFVKSVVVGQRIADGREAFEATIRQNVEPLEEAEP